MTKLEELTNVGAAMASTQVLEIIHNNVHNNVKTLNVLDNAKTLNMEAIREKVKRTEDGKGLAGRLSAQRGSEKEGARGVWTGAEAEGEIERQVVHLQ